jgi:hypothetical protein
MFARRVCLLVIFVACLAPLLSAQSSVPRSNPRIPHDLLSDLFSGEDSPAQGRSMRVPFIPELRERTGKGLPDVVRAAGMIFSASVKRIERRPATRGQSVETVAITFHVERAIRGATPGEDLTVAQWIGLWSGGQRYRVGERVLLFLYPRSKLGLTSCVGGMLGRFHVDAWGRVLLSTQQLTALHKDPVLGGRSRVPFSDFALAVRHAGEEE